MEENGRAREKESEEKEGFQAGGGARSCQALKLGVSRQQQAHLACPQTGERGRERKWSWRVGREADSCLSQWHSHMFAVPIIGRIKIVLGGPGTLGDQRPDVTSLVLATCNRSWLPEPPLSWQCLPHRILAGMDWDNEWGISLETLDSCKGLFNIIILGTR